MSAKLYKTNGDIINVTPKEKYFSLVELSAFVNGHIEILSNETTSIILNEKGKLKNLSFNENATKICKEMLFPSDYIAGDAIVCDSELLET